MKLIKIMAVLITLTVMLCSTAFAQLYKADYTTKLVLAGNGGLETPTAITIKAPPLAGLPYSLTLPTTAGTAGFILTQSGGPNNQLVWTDPSLGIILAGDVTGSAGANTVKKINGNPLGSTAPVSGNVLINDGTNWVSTPLSGDVTINGTGVTAIGLNKVTNGQFRQSGAFSLVGNSTNATANVADITLDPTLTFTGSTLAIDLTHANTWTGTQTITGAGKFIYTDGNQTAGFVLAEDGTGIAKWTDPATLSASANSVIINPSTSARNTITPATANAVPLTIKANAAAIGIDLQDWADSSGTNAIAINSVGNLALKKGNLGVALGNIGVGGKVVISHTQQLQNITDITATGTITLGSTGQVTVTPAGLTTINGGGNFKYVDGNQTAGFVLTEDASGVAKWADPASSVILAGDVTGSAGANTVKKINGNPLGSTAPVSGNVLINDGTNWVSTPLTGDVTINGTGVTAIGLNKVTNGQFRQSGAFSLVGNSTNATANVADITLNPTLTFTGSTLAIDLTHANNWTGTQTITGAGKFVYVDGNQTAGFVLTEDASGVAKWADPASSVILAGDVTGSAGANTVKKINGNPLGSTAPVSGNVLINDGTNWVSTPLTGDVTINGTGVTAIGLNKVTNGQFRQSGAFTLVGNSTNATANVADITLNPTLTFTGSTLAIDLTHANNWTGTQTITGAGKFVYVDGNQTAGFVLTEDASGVAKWADPASSVILAGDVTGSAGANTVKKINGNPLGSTAPVSGNVLINDGTNWVSTPLTGDVTINGTGVTAIGLNKVTNGQFRQSGAFTLVGNSTNATANVADITLDPTLKFSGSTLAFDLTHNNNWASQQTFTGAGNGIVVDLNADFTVQGHGATNGYVLTSDANGKATWTDPGTSVILAGDVINAANNNKIAATAQAGNDIVAAVNFTGVTAKSLNADVINYDATLQVTGNKLGLDLTHGNTWSVGTQEFGATAQTPGTVALTADLAIGTTNTLYTITGTGTVNGMQSGSAGRNVTLTNNGVGYITLTPSAGGPDQFIIPGGDPVIMGPNATVMLQYDITASGWRVIGGF